MIDTCNSYLIAALKYTLQQKQAYIMINEIDQNRTILKNLSLDAMMLHSRMVKGRNENLK